MSEVDARFVNTAIYVEPPVEDEQFKCKEYFLPINNFACGDSNSDGQLEAFDLRSNRDKEIYKRVSTSISDYSFLKKERRCKLDTKTNVLNKPSGNDYLYNKSPNNETYRQKTTRISKSCSEIFQKSVDLSVKRATSEHRQNNEIEKTCEIKRIKSKTKVQEKDNKDELAEAEKALEKEKIEKENFLKWLQQKKLERQDMQRKASEKEIELRKTLEDWNEMINPVKKLAVLQWHIQKKLHEKERKAEMERLRTLHEREQNLKLRKLEESSRAFAKWVEKSKTIPKPATQSLLPHQAPKPTFVNPRPWQSVSTS